ncbi:anhydro-N-acetylmuramic acid kinase [Brachybacterium phenoliresistens]|uniref:anhydro-N-acetylmuramic acid kinase n=1 Tax=Brachybacterium phenoliresistens TaxID=396014 RepID=UPI0004AED266|nr:anhydro-N-acetylmuramic acid kinase [Brachybacterium phenoliresistens]
MDPARPPAGASLRIIGLMSGTSHDAIDAAACDLWAEGDDLVLRPRGMISVPYAPSLRARLIAALPPRETTMQEVCRLDADIGRAFAEVAVQARSELCDGAADLVVSHGQTMFHDVRDGAVHGTLQLGQPAWIAEATGSTVVADLRSRDVAAGGQGAPLVSLVDALWLAGRDAAVVNLGGIANATLLRPGADPVAFDTGPANALIDAAVAEATGGERRYDEDGRLAAGGTVDDALLAMLLAEPYYALPAPKTTGKELFHADYLADRLSGRVRPRLEDLVATLTALTARTVADAVRGRELVVVSGGGTRNPALMGMLRAQLPGASVATSDDLGLPSAAKEALAFAVLGALTVHGLPGTLPSCTGARRASVLGAILPGQTTPPRILEAAPARLRVLPSA